MKNDQEIPGSQFEEIERYLMHEMDAEEEAAFTARLSADSTLKATTDELKLTFLAVQEKKLQSRLNLFHQEEIKTGSENKIFNTGKSWLAAASIVLVAGLTLWMLLKPAPEEELFADYFRPDEGLISAMGISEKYAFDRAMIDYKTGDYKAAIKIWDSLNVSQGANDTLSYFLGTAYLADKQTVLAIPYLKTVAEGKSIFEKDANWYLGLALLKAKRIKEAMMYIQRSGRPEKQSLLDKLKN